MTLEHLESTDKVSEAVEKINQCVDAINNFEASPTTLTKTCIAGENLDDGDYVYIYFNAGELRTKKAVASNWKLGTSNIADGFVLEAVIAGESIDVYLIGINDKLSDLTVGEPYYLSETVPGGVTLTPPESSGSIIQRVGVAVSDSELMYNPGEPLYR